MYDMDRVIALEWKRYVWTRYPDEVPGQSAAFPYCVEELMALA